MRPRPKASPTTKAPGRGSTPAPHTAPVGRGAARGTCGLAAELPPLGGRGSTPAPHTAPNGRGAARGTCSLAVELPPLGGGPRGSRVWKGFGMGCGSCGERMRGCSGKASWLPKYHHSGDRRPDRVVGKGAGRFTALIMILWLTGDHVFFDFTMGEHHEEISGSCGDAGGL